jgi:hypothetical protein
MQTITTIGLCVRRSMVMLGDQDHGQSVLSSVKGNLQEISSPGLCLPSDIPLD